LFSKPGKRFAECAHQKTAFSYDRLHGKLFCEIGQLCPNIEFFNGISPSMTFVVNAALGFKGWLQPPATASASSKRKIIALHRRKATVSPNRKCSDIYIRKCSRETDLSHRLNRSKDSGRSF